MTSVVKHNRFVVALFFIFFLACNNHTSRVRGLIQHVSPQLTSSKLYLMASDGHFNWPGDQKNIIDSCIINDDGYYSFEHIPANKPLLFDISDGENKFIDNFYLMPGEKLRLDFDAKYNPPLLLVTAQAGSLNHLLEEYSDTFYREKTTKEFYYAGSNYLLAPEYAKYIDQRHEQQIKFVQQRLNNSKTDTLFYTYLKSEIDYQWANDKTAFLWKKWIRNEEVPLDSNYFNFTKSIRLNNPEALISPAYIRFLHLYIREMHRQLPLEEQKKKPSSYARCDLALQYLEGMPLKVALLQILKDEISNCKSLGAIDQNKTAEVNTFAKHLDTVSGSSDFSVYFRQHHPQ